MNVRRIAGAANLLDSLWTLYVVLDYTSTVRYCPAFGCPSVLNDWVLASLLVIGVLLLIDSVICFTGRWLAFPLGALLSLLTVPFAVLQCSTLGPAYSSIAIILGILALVLNVMAILARARIPEESHPLNLPVFG